MKPANAGLKFPAETLNRDEIHRLMAALGRGRAGVRDRALVVVLWRCGLRIAEALALAPKDVDLEAGTVVVLCGKGRRRRVVGLDPEAAAVLEKWILTRRKLGIRGGPLFCTITRPNIGDAIHSSVVREKLKAAGRRAGIEKRVHPHGFRHTFASELAREGVPVNVIQKLLGHSDLATTARYIDHLTPWEAIDVARRRTWAPVPAGQPPLAA